MTKKKVRKPRSRSKPTSKHPHGKRYRSPSLEHFDVLAPLSSLISSHEALAAAAINFLGWENVEPLLPPCLQGRRRDDVILLVATELDCLSKKRISRILKGETAPSDSSSSEVTGDENYSFVDAERQQHNFPDSYEKGSLKSSSYIVSSISSTSHSKVGDIKSEEDYCSDMELAEGFDEEVDNLPDVSKT